MLEALAAGPSRYTVQELDLSGARLECEDLCALLPQLPALQTLDISGNDGLMDPPALLAAAEAAPQLHTLLCHGVGLAAPPPAWRAMAAERAAPGRRRLLRILPWDSLALAAPV